jgi:hypothetical protein
MRIAAAILLSCCAAVLAHLADVWWNGLAAHTNAPAVNVVAVHAQHMPAMLLCCYAAVLLCYCAAMLLCCRTLLMFGGMALPPTPMRLQSMLSPSSVNVSRPTTTPFSDATTAQQQSKWCLSKRLLLDKLQSMHVPSAAHEMHGAITTVYGA